MKRKTYALTGLFLAVALGISAIWNFYAGQASAQKSEETGTLGVSEYNARNEFSLTQGGTSGVWRYGYTVNASSDVFVPFPNTNTYAPCSSTPGSGTAFQEWRNDALAALPQLGANVSGAQFFCGTPRIPTDAIYMHPGFNSERAVVRFTAPVTGTYQVAGVFEGLDNSGSRDVKILKNSTGTPLLSTIVGGQQHQPFNFSVPLNAGDTLDFHVGSNGSYNFDATGLSVTVGQPPTACETAPANLQVNVPAGNSPVDVQSVNTNAQLVGDATYTNAGKVGRAFELDGSGDYVRIEDNAAQRPATAVTLEGWFKFDSTSGLISLISKPIRNSPLNSHTLYLENGQLRGLIGKNSGQFTRALSSFVPQTGVWHHLAFTYDYTGGVSTLKLYANGVEVTSGQDGTPNLPLFYDANPYPLLIGGEYENNAPGFTLDGQADEVSVYGRALTQTEIFNIVQQGSFGKCPPAACVQPPNNLVSWLAGEQNALDSRSNNHGTNNGATFSTGKVGQAFNFDGSGQHLTFGNTLGNFGTSDFSVELWLQTSSTRQEEILSKRSCGTPGVPYFHIRKLADGTVLVELGNFGGSGGTNLTSTRTINDGVYHHITVERVGDTLALYIDGTLEINGTGAAAVNLNNSAPFVIGALGCIGVDPTQPFTGKIDEVSLYSRALSVSEISSIYNAGQSGKCKPSPLNSPANQIAWFTGDGETADFTGLNSAGTLQGDTNFRVGRVAQGFSFDGSGDYITTADSPNWDFGTGNFAVEGWFKSPSPTGVQRMIAAGSMADGANNLWALGYGDICAWGCGQRINFAVFNGGGYSDFSSDQVQFFPNTWHHIAVVRSGASFIFYLDGAAVGTVPIGAGFAVNGGSTGAIIGARYNNNPSSVFEFANGMLDEVSVFNRALSASEIAAVYNAGTAGKLKEKPVSPIILTAQLNAKNGKRFNPANGTVTPATVELTDATVTFANVTSSGTVAQNSVDLGLLPSLPSSVTFTGLAYDISTTAGYQNGSPDDVRVCFNVPSLAGVPNLRILHLESSVWVNRTASGGTASNLCTDNLTSLSPFVIVQSLAPTAANVSVSGRISDAGGAGLSGVIVTLTDSRGESVSTRSNTFGLYSFRDVAVGDVYTVSVYSKRYAFAVSSQAINVQDAVENVDFTADSESLKFESSGKPDEDLER